MRGSSGSWRKCAGNESQGRAPKKIIILLTTARPLQWISAGIRARCCASSRSLPTDHVFREGTVGLLVTAPHRGDVTDSARGGFVDGHLASRGENGVVSIAPDAKSGSTAMRGGQGQRPSASGLVPTATVYRRDSRQFQHTCEVGAAISQALVDQFLRLEPDVLMGGAADYFLPRASPRKRKDRQGRDRSCLRAMGYEGREEHRRIDGHATAAKVLGLVCRTGDMDFEIRSRPREGTDYRGDGRGRAQGIIGRTAGTVCMPGREPRNCR